MPARHLIAFARLDAGAFPVGIVDLQLDKIDLGVIGTSMGGLVGGLYALGYTPDQMDTLIRGIDWQWALSDKLSRKYISYSNAKYREKYLLSIPFYYEKDYYRMMMADVHRFDPVRDRKSVV